jgi:Domain of unknown function (DUF1877)
MSVTTYYGRLSEEEYAAMRADPDGLAQFVTGVVPRERMLYLDKATPVIAWLLSPLKRHEQAHFAAVCNAEDIDNFTAPDLGPEPPMDEILVPLEGRGTKDEALDVGMGPACVISPSDVKRYSRMLADVDESRLRQQLDFPALDAAALPVDYWVEEGEQTFSEYIVPLLRQLQAFYASAESSNQVVLVWYS